MPLEPDDSPGFLLWHVTLRWQREMVAALAPLDLTHVQFVLLAATWWLNSHGEHPNQLAVATQAGTDVKMTSQVLRTLEAKGLIRRTRSAQDRRLMNLELTEEGRAAYPRMREISMTNANRFLRGFTKAEARQLESFLSRMLENAQGAATRASA